MAIDSLTKIIPKWETWSRKAQKSPVLEKASYPFPQIKPKFLGTIIQNFRPRNGAPVKNFQQWINQINEKVTQGLYPDLKSIGMTLPDSAYESLGLEGDSYCLARINDKQIGQKGAVLAKTKGSQDKFKEIFSDLGHKIIQLTSHENSN